MSWKTDLWMGGLWVIFMFCLGERRAQAIDLQMNGFADLVGTQSGTSLPIDNIGNQANHLTVDPESRLGLNLSADLGGNVTFASQILAQGRSGGQYDLQADWLFATYRPVEGLSIRAGKQINPAYLYSEQFDVGFTYLWTRLPYEVYGSYPIDSFNGLAVIYSFFLGELQLRTEVFGGAGDQTISAPSSTFTVSSNDDKGIETALSSDHFKFRLGYISANATGTASAPALLAQPPGGVVTGTFTSGADIGTVQILSSGASFDFKGLMASAEMVRFWGSGTLVHSTTAAYGSLGYRVLPKLTPYVVYSWKGDLSGTAYVYPDPTVSSTAATDQHSDIFGLNYKLTPSVALKAEYMRTQEYFADATKNFGANTFTLSVDLVF
jgi:hypothetical protein